MGYVEKRIPFPFRDPKGKSRQNGNMHGLIQTLAIFFPIKSQTVSLDFGGHQVSVLVSQGCSNKSPETWRLKTTEIYTSILKVGSMKSRVSQGRGPSEVLEKNLLYDSLQLLVVAGNPWCFLACSYITPISASVLTWPTFVCVSLHPNLPLLFLIKVPVIGFSTHPNSV